MNNLENILSKFNIILNNNWGVFLIYFLLALFFTFPLILDIKDAIPISIDTNPVAGSDAFYSIWDFWFFKYNLIDLQTNPFSHSDLVFYPNGFDYRATGYDNLFDILLALPLQIIFDNLILVYNILIIFNFIFASYTTYILVNYLTGDKKIAFLGGLIFGFSPFMIARGLGHLKLLTSGAIPLFILFFLKLLKEPKIKNSLFLAIAFLLVSISSWVYGLFSLIFITSSFLFLIVYNRQLILNKDYLKRFSLFIILTILFILPIISPMIKVYSNGQMKTFPIGEAIYYSADALSYLTPPPLNNLGGQFIDYTLFRSFSNNYTESTTFLGFLEVVFIFIYIRDREKLKGKGNLWLFLFIIFFILSLGPFFKVSGNVFDKLPLPYYFIFSYIPFFSFAREPVRLSIFIMLFTTIIFSLTLKYILGQKWEDYRKNILVAFFSFFIIAERVILPYPIEITKTPLFYNKIAQEKNDYAILDLPIGVLPRHQIYNFYQTIHKKRIVNGGLHDGAVVPEVYSWIENNRFLRENICWPEMKAINDGINLKEGKKLDKENLIKEFKNVKIKYIIIHKDIIDKYEKYFISLDKSLDKNFNCQKLRDNINDLFGDKQPIFEDESIKVYEI